ncbi:hypothetical protein [Thermotoga neapolitana]|uniref:Tfp pilus assembly protein ATPase PilM-like protein n=1 Tax=Thermotoga neapolitana (strain ATCC 49049 / DSM 4359 / NBRC 107923 / NS-E) TaxID=309803 RepID=B9K743_THENN|nr:hypothetical protein [Thermotoga neapolitana]ACM22776.1 Putative uncharacterized protein precursor [Thermotoga neapolitana DSM 4359]KFZ22396.1 hypothetical protein LA10_03017 [Thermotoga neapolitana LA10]
MQIFYNDILALNLCSHCVEIVRARKRGSKLRVLKKVSSVGDTLDDEKRKETISSLMKGMEKDLEDIVVANMPMENVLIMRIKVPPSLNRQNAIEYATMEISRNLGIVPEQLIVAPLEIHEGEGLFFVSKVNQVKAFVSELMEAGFPETDVVIPDVVKYLEFFDFYFKRRLKGITVLVVASFFNDYYSIVVLKDDHYRSCRMVFSIFWDYMDVVAENTGIQPKELFEGMVEVSLDFLQPYFGDFLLELDREVKISLDEVSLDIADQFFYIIDPPVFFQSFMQALQKFEGTVLKEGPVPFVKSSVSMGGLGLVLRGGREIGKVKHLSV